MIANDRVTVSTVVRAAPDATFRFFTDEIDSWWKRGPRFRSHDGAMRFDAGRLMEGGEQIGRVLAWEPGNKLAFELWTWSFQAGERTEVEVRFEALGDGTRVTVEHRGWTPRLPGGAEHRTTVGLWWGTLLPRLVGQASRSAG